MATLTTRVVIDHRPKETEMPGMTPPVADERAGLLAFLQQQRNAVHISAFGVTDEQARTAASTRALTVGGLIKHLADMERTWTATMTQQPGGLDAMDYLDHFRLTDDESLEDALAEYAAAAAATDAAVAGFDDLGSPVPVPRGVPWFPADVDGRRLAADAVAQAWQPADELALTNPS
jgi:hypothetical protein